MKDKIKIPQPIHDDTRVKIPKIETIQCSKCLATYVDSSMGHKCTQGWHRCSICGLSLEKKQKTKIINGIGYVSLNTKKSFRIWDKIVCWSCVFMLVKEFKRDEM